MPQRELEITINADGEVELHLKGYKGTSCRSVAAAFEKIVGQVKSLQDTSEAFEPDETVHRHQEQQH